MDNYLKIIPATPYLELWNYYQIVAYIQLSISYYATIFLRLKDIFFSLPKQSQNLDPSYKMDLDFQDSFGRETKGGGGRGGEGEASKAGFH